MTEAVMLLGLPMESVDRNVTSAIITTFIGEMCLPNTVETTLSNENPQPSLSERRLCIAQTLRRNVQTYCTDPACNAGCQDGGKTQD